MWSYFKLKKAPKISIHPLLKEEELSFFIDREKEIEELSLYMSDEGFQNILISGPAGIGKTSLVSKVGVPRADFVRIDISYLEENQSVLERITIGLLDFASQLGGKGMDDLIETFYFATKEIALSEKKAKAKIPMAEGSIEHKKGLEKARKELIIGKELLIEKLLGQIKSRLGNNLPVIFLDESDHLPEELQDKIFAIVEPLLVSSLCKVIFSTRREVRRVFQTDENSRYRARFMCDLEINPLRLSSSNGRTAREILDKKLAHEAAGGYQYPFDSEFDRYIEIVSNGNLRELLRYTYLVMTEAILRKLPLPISANSACEILAERGFLISDMDIKDYHILKLLENEALSPSDENLQSRTNLKRSTLNKKLGELEGKRLLGKDTEGKRVVYRTTPKGVWFRKMYEAVRF